MSIKIHWKIIFQDICKFILTVSCVYLIVILITKNQYIPTFFQIYAGITALDVLRKYVDPDRASTIVTLLAELLGLWALYLWAFHP